MPAMVEAQPWPVSPSPWRKMTVAVCLPLGATTTGSGMVSSRAAAEAELAAGWSLDLVHFPPIHRQHGQGPHHRAAALCNREGLMQWSHSCHFPDQSEIVFHNHVIMRVRAGRACESCFCHNPITTPDFQLKPVKYNSCGKTQPFLFPINYDEAFIT